MAFDIKEFLQSKQPQVAGNQPANTPTGDPSIFGGSSDFLQNLFRRGSEGTPDFISKFGESGRRNIGRLFDRNRERLAQRRSSSGFRGGGANEFTQLAGEQFNAFGDLDSNLAGLTNQFNQQNRSNLLGLTQFQGGQQSGQNRLDENSRQFNLSDLFRNRQLTEQRRQFDESQGFNFGDFLGNLVGAGGQIGAAKITASDKRLKKDIKYTGEKTKDGIPLAEFKYKGSDRKFKGVIAQDVEKVKPSAVFKAVDYSKLPDAYFKEVA